jgi:hypothetical protein
MKQILGRVGMVLIGPPTKIQKCRKLKSLLQSCKLCHNQKIFKISKIVEGMVD